MEQSFQQEPHAIHLISYTRGGTEFEINTADSYNLFEMLSDKPVAVIMVAGEARSGKSFLANRILGRQNGFDLGSNVTACTKGIWMWSEPVILESGEAVLVMDCEGINAADKESSFDTKLLTLGVLLASTFIFNQKMVLSSDTFQNLAKVAMVAKGLLGRSGARPDELFPKLMVVLRDFQSNLAEDGFKSAKDYFQNALIEKPEDESSWNAQRKLIKESFSSRDCITVALPVADRDKLKHLEKFEYSDLRPIFQAQMKDLVKKIKDTAESKRVQGRMMTGSRLKELAYAYIQAINAGETPHIPTTLERVLLGETRDASQDLLYKLRDELDAEFDEEILPFEQEEQDRILWEKYDATVDALHKRFASLVSAKSLVSETEALGKQSLGEFEAKQRINYDQSAILSNHLLKSLIEQSAVTAQDEEETDDMPFIPDKFSKYFEEWGAILEEYLQKAVGTAKTDFISDFIYDTEQLHNELPLQESGREIGTERGGSKIMGEDDDLQYSGRVHLGYHDSVGPVVREKPQLLRMIDRRVAQLCRELEEFKERKKLRLEKQRLHLKKLERETEQLEKQIDRDKGRVSEMEGDKQEMEVRIAHSLDFNKRQEQLDKELLEQKEKDLKKLNEQLADKNDQVEKLALAATALAKELDKETQEYNALVVQKSSLDSMREELQKLKEKAEKSEPLMELRKNEAYQKITGFFAKLKEELSAVSDGDIVDVQTLEQERAQLEKERNGGQMQSPQKEREDSVVGHEEFTRQTEALENEIRGYKQDKQRLELHLRRTENEVQRLTIQVQEEEQKFEEGAKELKNLRDEARKVTHNFHGLESEIKAKLQRLQKIQEDITIESLKHCNLMEDNSELINLVPLLKTAAAMNRKISVNLGSKFQDATRKEIIRVAGRYFA